MKVIICTKYGDPDVLQLKDVENPTPKDNEVLVKVHVASVNASDVEIMRGRYQPPFSRKPRYEILGSDITGRIEAIGSNIEQFQPGDDIFGDTFGSNKYRAFLKFIFFQDAANRRI